MEPVQKEFGYNEPVDSGYEITIARTMEKGFEIYIKLASGISARFPLTEEIRIGRAAGNEISLPDDHLSRIHVQIKRERGRYILEDLKSRNGTFLNETRLDEKVALTPGDRIKMGRCLLVFQEAREPEGLSETEQETFAASQITDDYPHKDIVAVSPAMKKVIETALKSAAHDAPVMVLGESGTGKEVVAQLIHTAGPRRSGPFVAVNCPALPPSLIEGELFGVEKGVATGVNARTGKFEQAQGGTLFLDEIGDMEPSMQAKLLRIIEESEVIKVGGSRSIPLDVRIITATNHNLEEDLATGRFREDLYYRLNTLKIRIPPLRERREDIIPLCRFFLMKYGGPGITITAQAEKVLEAFGFPGNVRELMQWVRRAVIMRDGSEIGVEDLLEEMCGDGQAGDIDALYRRIVDEGGNFWELVRKPYLARELSREEVRKLIARGMAASKDNIRNLSRLFGIEKDYKKLLNFLRNQKLYEVKNKKKKD
ncbi:sigma 54-interacting transcriptional regulator [Acidobacteriota bacterium]